jgi:diguanylate cyclase (GGDEF)-like protein
MRDFLSGQGKSTILAIGLVSAMVVGVLDYLTGSPMALTAVYLLPVGFVAWHAGAGAGVTLALVCAVAWLAAGHYAGRPFSSTLLMLWQFLSVAVTNGAFAILLARLHRAQSRTQALSLVDFLTGALNSRAFYNILENEHRKCARYERPLTLIYIGLDNFKRVNDRFGHTIGDTVLLKVARTMMKYLRATDRVARLGGDEFIVLLPETDREAAKKVVPKICDRLAAEMEDGRWPITLSVAVVTYACVPSSARDMIKMAEKLMRVIKKDGKDAVRYASYKG